MALSCYRCGASLSELSLPLRRLEECPDCAVELHVCRMCVNFAPERPKGCAEDDAIEVRDKSSANFCDYFKPSEWAYRPGADEAEAAAKAQLRALFGEPGGGAADAQEPTEPREAGARESEPPEPEAKSPEERALEQARSLFKK